MDLKSARLTSRLPSTSTISQYTETILRITLRYGTGMLIAASGWRSEQTQLAALLSIGDVSFLNIRAHTAVPAPALLEICADDHATGLERLFSAWVRVWMRIDLILI